LTIAYHAADKALIARPQDAGMIDPYDPPHPDGPTDLDDFPAPLVGDSWLADDPEDDGPSSVWDWSKEDPA
jgi:hypothetical protein